MALREPEILEHAVRTMAEQAVKDLVPRREIAPRSIFLEEWEWARQGIVELPDDVGADLAGGGQDPKEIPPRRGSERVSEASRILPKHRGASVSAAWPPGELPDRLLDRLEVESERRAVTLCGAPVFVNAYG